MTIKFENKLTQTTVPLSFSGGATPGCTRSNDLNEELPPWLTNISLNFINTLQIMQTPIILPPQAFCAA